MIEAYMNATLEVLRLAGQMFLDRIDHELRRFAEDLHDFIYNLDRNPRRDWRERFDAFLADQSSRGRDISPESRLDLIAYLEVWERNVYGGPPQRSFEASITRIAEPAAVPAEPASSYSVLPPQRSAEPKPPKRKPTWWRPPTGDRADFYRKLNDARSCIYDLERMLPAIANRIEAAKPDVPLEIDDELNAVESLIWRHNDLMESAREIWLTKDLGDPEFAELDLGPNPASLGLPLFTDEQQANRAKEQLKKIGVRINQKIAFLDDVIFAMKAAEAAGNVASVLIGGLIIKAAWHGGKLVFVKTVAKMAASIAASALIGKATKTILDELGVEEETVEKVSNAVELISWLLVLRRMKLLGPGRRHKAIPRNESQNHNEPRASASDVNPEGIQTANAPNALGHMSRPNSFGLIRSSNKSRLNFAGFEVRGVRDLGHLDETTLRAMRKTGAAAVDKNGVRLHLHHHQQNPRGPIIEVPKTRHKISNRIQHPHGNQAGRGLTDQERHDFNNWRTEYWKARASEELARRGLIDD